MRKLILLLVVALYGISSVSLAQWRPDTFQMSCAEARGLVAAHGAVVLYSGRYTYDRFVRDSSFCSRPDRADPAWVETRDVPQCSVGYRCVARPLRWRD
jgi:hypothetical protein